MSTLDFFEWDAIIRTSILSFNYLNWIFSIYIKNKVNFLAVAFSLFLFYSRINFLIHVHSTASCYFLLKFSLSLVLILHLHKVKYLLLVFGYEWNQNLWTIQVIERKRISNWKVIKLSTTFISNSFACFTYFSVILLIDIFLNLREKNYSVFLVNGLSTGKFGKNWECKKFSELQLKKKLKSELWF